jgi:hypothetical protein
VHWGSVAFYPPMNMKVGTKKWPLKNQVFLEA